MLEQPTARVWVDIDLKKLKSNLKKIADKVKPSKVMAVLKADAYGLGLVPIAQALKSVGVHCFGVAESREALAIVNLGIPIHLLGGLLKSDIPFVVKEGIIAPITDLNTARLINEEALKQKKTAECHFLVDTGMGRLGILLPDAEATICQALEFPGIKCTGIYTHFPYAYGDSVFSFQQVQQTIRLLNRLKSRGITFKSVHIANSDGINNIPDSYKEPYTLVRAGLNLYGIFEIEGQKSLELETVISLKTRLVAVRRLEEGTTISYGRTCTLETPTMVGTIAIGYADGLPFAMSNGGDVLLHGMRCPILGRISMDYTTISVNAVPSANVGDEVICLGHEITVDEWAQRKNSIPYDIICAFGSRVERRYINE